MAKLGTASERQTVGDLGFQKIADLLPHTGDDIDGILIEAAIKQSIDDNGNPKGNPYWTMRLFTPDDGEIKITEAGSNLGKQLDAINSKKEIDLTGRTLPAICIELRGISEYIIQKGEREGQQAEWFNVKITKYAEDNNVIRSLREQCRKYLMNAQPMPQQQQRDPYRAQDEAEKQQSDADFDREMNSAMNSADY
jgi:hypothetical protein